MLLVPVVLGLWQHSTSLWEHGYRRQIHLVVAGSRERDGNMGTGWGPNIPFKGMPHPNDLTSLH
jgi:hypothetical protein